MAVSTAGGAGLEQLEARLSEFRLDNGLRFAVLPRDDSPVVSVCLYVNSGSSAEPAGKTGLAMMFEQLIASGPASIGSGSAEAELAARRAVETAIDRLEEETRKAPDGFSLARQTAETDLKFALARLQGMHAAEAFVGIMRSSGFSQIQTHVAADFSRFQFSFPQGRFELWCKLYSEWLLKPAFREFYAIRDRLSQRPIDPVLEKLVEGVFPKHPYSRLALSSSQDRPLRVADAEAFLRTHYSVSNMAVAVAGDIQPSQARRLAEQYFGRLPPAPPPEFPAEETTPTGSELRLQAGGASQDSLAIGFRRPGQGHPDSLFFDILGRICRDEPERALHEALVTNARLAQGVGLNPSFPGERWGSLFLLIATPVSSAETGQLERAMVEFVESLAAQPLAEKRVRMAANRSRAAILEQLQSNDSASAVLARFLATEGSAKAVVKHLEGLHAFTPADFQRAASRYLVAENRVVLEARKEAKAK